MSLRGHGIDPAKRAVGDRALGVRSSLVEVYPESRAKRCRARKTVNVPDKLPKSPCGDAQSMLR